MLSATIKNLDHIDSHVYDSRTSRFLGKWGHRSLHKTEGFALKGFDAYQLMKYPEHYHQIDFILELFRDEKLSKEEVDWTVSTSWEKTYTNELIKAGEISLEECWKQRAKRIKKITRNLGLFVGSAPVSFPLGVFGIAARKYVQSHMNDFVYLKPKGVHKKGFEWCKGDPLKIGGFNGACTEFHIMDRINQVSSTHERIPVILSFLMKRKLDIICLQEAFDVDEFVPELTKCQKKGYHVLLASKRKQVFGMNSGLIIISRFPFVDCVGFAPFENGKGIDKRANKGAFSVLIELQPGNVISVTNTHLQGCFSHEDIKERIVEREKQFNSVTELSDATAEDKKVKDKLIVGDFNTSRFDDSGISGAIQKYDYESLVNGLLKKGYKDLTVPDEEEDFAHYLKREIDFDPYNPASNETGFEKGSCLDTSAVSYHFFSKIVALQVEKEVDKSRKKIQKAVNRRLKGKHLKNATFESTIDRNIRNVCRRIFVKRNTVDHILLKNNPGNNFSEDNYISDYVVPKWMTILSDHLLNERTLWCNCSEWMEE